MKIVMKRDFQVSVVDVAMPIRRSNVRRDLQLLCQVIRDEHGGRLDGNVVDEICDKFSLRPGGWRRVSSEAADVHRLWDGGGLTEAGRSCADDGIVLDFEDGPHRIWYIEADEPIGPQILHVAGWGEFELNPRAIGEEQTGNAFSRLQGLQRQYSTAVEPARQCVLQAPEWWTRAAKRPARVQEQSAYVSGVSVAVTSEFDGRGVRISVTGLIRGCGRADIILRDAPWAPAGVNISEGAVDAAVKAWVTKGLATAQRWDAGRRRIVTDHSLHDDNSVVAMKQDFEFAGLAAPGVGIWPAVSIDQVPLAPRDAAGAAEWLARLFWLQCEPGHMTRGWFEAEVQRLASESGLGEWLPSGIGAEGGFRSAVRKNSLGAPGGASYFLNAADDLRGALQGVGEK